jgi:Predicted membrane protein (DUF2142)
VLRKVFTVKPLLAFLAFLALALSWSLGTPLLSAADEPEQSIRAAAVVRGEFSGIDEVWNFAHWQSTYSTPDYLEVAYRLPRNLVLALAKHDPACYAFRSEVTPNCTVHANKQRIAQAEVQGTALSHMNYSPLYYALVGWPSLLLRGDAALYGMRIVSALITALLLAAAFRTTARRGRAAAVGVVAAATPAAIYFGAVVNPSGLEITSALLAWVSLISMTRAEPGAASRRDRILFTAAAATLVLVRPLGPAWLAIIVVAVLATSPRPREWVRQAVRGRGARWMGGVLAAAILATGAWDATQNTMGIVPHANPAYTLAKGMHITLSQTPLFLIQMVGLLGWNDVHIPAATTFLWYGTFIALLLAALVLGGRRERLILLAMAVLVVAFPVAFEGLTGGSYGVGWQGRYTLPLAIGVPLLTAEVLGRRLRAVERGVGDTTAGGRVEALRGVPRMLSMTVGGTLGVAYLCEVWWAWRRYAEGLGDTSTFVPWHPRWSPIIGWPTMLGLALVGSVGLFALLASSGTYPGEMAAADGTVPQVPSQAPGARDGVDPLVSKLYE